MMPRENSVVSNRREYLSFSDLCIAKGRGRKFEVVCVLTITGQNYG